MKYSIRFTLLQPPRVDGTHTIRMRVYWNKTDLTHYLDTPISPSEVVVRIGCLSGTVRKSSTGGDYFRLFGVDGEASIDFVMLDTPRRELVRELLKAQEEE